MSGSPKSRTGKSRLDKPLTDPPPIPQAAIDAALEVLRSGRLFRYGEDTAAELHAARLEAEFAAYVGARYCVAMASGGSTMMVALKTTGVGAGSPVLFNAFTLAPVPGSIVHAGGEAVPVEIGDDYLIDLDDLVVRAKQTGARHLMLTHMRGHIADLERTVEVCEQLGLTVIEDCAHTMGARWNGRMTGTFGKVGCFSTQTFKHINSGEGGLLVTDDDEVAAAAILYSGSYAQYAQHGAAPPREVFQRLLPQIPNFSVRMSNLEAALLRPQLAELDRRAVIWRERYTQLHDLLVRIPGVSIPDRDAREEFVPSSIQFSIEGVAAATVDRFLAGAAARGVMIKWFGRSDYVGFTSRREHWAYIDDDGALEATSRTLASLYDLRIPLSLTEADCQLIGEIIEDELRAAKETEEGGDDDGE